MLDWDLVFKNAARVRKIEPNDRHAIESWSVSFEVLHAIASYSTLNGLPMDPSRSLFPNLRTLGWDWHGYDEMSFSFASYLVTDKLQSLTIQSSTLLGSDASIRSIRLSLQSILERCPDLRELSLTAAHFGARWAEVCDELTLQLHALPLLRTFHTGHSVGIALEDLYRVARHPALRDAQFYVGEDHSMAFVPPPKSVFLSLRKLHVGGDVVRLGQVLEAVGASSLSTMKMALQTPYPPAAQLRDATSKLTSFKSSLQDVELLAFTSRSRWRNDTLSITEIRDHLLRPLLSLQHLTRLCLWTNLDILLDDDDIEAMAKAWPKLKSLDIGPYSIQEARPSITLAGLLPLSDCPDLDEITLSVEMCQPSAEAHERLKQVISKEPRSPLSSEYAYCPVFARVGRGVYDRDGRVFIGHVSRPLFYSVGHRSTARSTTFDYEAMAGFLSRN